MKKKHVKMIEQLKQETDVGNIDVISFLNKYKTGQIVFPSALQRNFKLSEERTFKILDNCETFGILERSYVARCPNCLQLDSKFYPTMYNKPYYINCEHCDEQTVVSNDDFEVVYNVL